MHGCPYKTFDKGSLTAALTKLRIQPQAVQEAVSKAQGGHFQLACAAAWEGAHGCSCDTGINHPNQVYASRGVPLRASSQELHLLVMSCKHK